MSEYLAPAAKPAKPEKKKYEDKSSKERADFMATARKRLQIAIDAFDANRKHQLDDMRFAAANPDNMWAWPEAVKNARLNDVNGARPVLTINKLPQHIRLVTNEQRQNRPSIKVIPVDDAADPETAKIINGMIRHIESRSDADIAYDMAGEGQVIQGEGYIRVLTEYADVAAKEQDILIAPIRNALSVYLDPDGLERDPTGRHCQWGFITDRVKKSEFAKLFPDAAESDWDDLGAGDQSKGWMDGEYLTIAEYFYIEDSGAVCWAKLSPLEPLEEGEWAGRYIPIARMVGNEYEVDGKLVISGIVRNAKDACRMYNYNASMEVEQVSLAPKSPWLGAVGQFATHSDKFATANTVNHSRLEYDPIEANGVALPPPQRVAPPIPPSGIISAKLAAGDDIQATVGQYNPSVGAEAKEKSGRAIVARQRQADVGTFHYLDNQSKAIRHVGRIVIDLIPKVYDTKRVARVLGEDGTASTVTLDPSLDRAMAEVNDGDAIRRIYNPTIGEYDVRVTTGPGYTTQRQEAAQMLVELSQGVQDPVVALTMRYFAVKYMDFSGSEDFAKTLKSLLPPPVQQSLADAEGTGDQKQAQQIPPEVAAMVDQLKGALGQAAGQLEATQQALAQKDQELQANAVELSGKQVEAQRRIEEATLKRDAEGAKAEAVKAQAAADIHVANAQVEQARIAAETEIQKGAPAREQEVATAKAMDALGEVLSGLMEQVAALSEQVAAQNAPKVKSMTIQAPGGTYQATVSDEEIAIRTPQGAVATGSVMTH